MSDNPFELFKTPVSVSIKNTDLEKKYSELTIAHHPDNFQNEKEKAYAQSTMEKINAAYEVLSSSSKRARLMLALYNIPIDEETTLKNPDLLEEIFLIKERNEKEEIRTRFEDAQKEFQVHYSKKDIKNLLPSYWRLVYLEKALCDLDC